MVADEDIGLSFFKVFTAIGIISYEIQFAENPRPKPQKFVADPSEQQTKNER